MKKRLINIILWLAISLIVVGIGYYFSQFMVDYNHL